MLSLDAGRCIWDWQLYCPYPFSFLSEEKSFKAALAWRLISFGVHVWNLPYGARGTNIGFYRQKPRCKMVNLLGLRSNQLV